MDEAANPPPLKLTPKYGYYPHWPQDGDDWVHPEDVALARSHFPSQRIWRRDEESGAYHTIRYGDLTLRVKSALWQEVAKPDYEIGDLVEVRTRLMRNEAHTGRVAEVQWDDYQGQVVYHIQENDRHLPNKYTSADLKPVDPAEGREFSRLPSDTPEATEGVDELTEGLPKDDKFGGPWV
ncbi:hypothetical protein KOR34_41220 [Posidoniimonas corsicana]|uniref:Uncharacterized protein n=1 Tax=Posidoniimonas corsicana TaxID=1938618 RepID=A0A5C5V324_9BACT|nr:hypothetical protein [Posidoniimonas corsicana]TWT32359.1 hypothetical protein KOR34_41220 [Posidoniimonas corsicana]